MKKSKFKRFASAVSVTMMAANIAHATTIDFSDGSGSVDGFNFAPARIVNGNCDLAAQCLALNDNETTTMTFAGGAFTLQSVHFTLLGKGTGNTLTVFESGNPLNMISFSVPTFTHNTYYTESFGNQFSGVGSITFATSGGGNVRIDELEAIPLPKVGEVPLPAGGWLLGSSLLGVIGLSRKSKTI